MRRRIVRFGIVGDVHAEHDALASALAYFAAPRVEPVLVVGDIVDGSGDASACCALLREHGVEVMRGKPRPVVCWGSKDGA